MAQNTILHGALATPVNAAFSTATTGGTLPAGTHFYRVSALDGKGGETLASAETSQATTGATSTVTVNWGAVTGATGYKVFGRTSGGQQLLVTLGNVTTWTDDGSATPSGALPSENTTGLKPGTSSDVVVAAGATVTLGLFASDGIPGSEGAGVYVDTPGSDLLIAELTGPRPVLQFTGPCTLRVKKGETSVAFGAFSET
jgi:hypothetical protein